MNAAVVNIDASWKRALAKEFDEPYFSRLAAFVREEYSRHTVYPPGSKIFSALDHTPFDKVKVVIVGQDPYHGPGQANGLCFSVNSDTAIPPSLRNIFEEISRDLGVGKPASGDLEPWAKQGVLLLNATLTVRAGMPASHRGKGWETFTDAVVQELNAQRQGLVFMLWGASAREKGAAIDRNRHLVLTSAHPSPLSAYRGFKGNGHFGRANKYLSEKGLVPIDWAGGKL